MGWGLLSGVTCAFLALYCWLLLSDLAFDLDAEFGYDHASRTIIAGFAAVAVAFILTILYITYLLVSQWNTKNFFRWLRWVIAVCLTVSVLTTVGVIIDTGEYNAAAVALQLVALLLGPLGIKVCTLIIAEVETGKGN